MRKKVKGIIVIVLVLLIILLMVLGIKHFTNKKYNNMNSKSSNYEDKKKIYYENKEIYFVEGNGDPEGKVFYNENNLIIYDKTTGTKKIIAQTFNNDVVICDKKLYYIVSNFEDRTVKFKSYDLETEKQEELDLPYINFGLYSMVSYNYKIYFGVVLYNTSGQEQNTNSGYGIIEYDIINKKFKKFSDMDIRYLDTNFLFIDNGFITVYKNNIYFIDLEGKSKIVYQSNEYILNEEVKKVSDEIIEIPIMGAAKDGAYLTEIGYLRLDISQNYKVISVVVD